MDYLSRLCSYVIPCYKLQEEAPEGYTPIPDAPAIREVADRTFSMSKLIAEHDFPQKQFKAISKEDGEDQICHLYLDRAKPEDVISILEKIPVEEYGLVIDWLKQDVTHPDRLIALNNMAVFPLKLQLSDGPLSLSPYETLLLTTECLSLYPELEQFQTDFKTDSNFSFPITAIRSETIKELLSLFRGQVTFEPTQDLNYAISFLNAHKLLSILSFVAQTALNQARSIEEIPAVLDAHPQSWFLIPKKDFDDILQSKIRFCRNSEEFALLINIAKMWSNQNPLEPKSVLSFILFPPQADATWLPYLKDYQGGIEFNNCSQIISQDDDWQYLSNITTVRFETRSENVEARFLIALPHLQQLEQIEHQRDILRFSKLANHLYALPSFRACKIYDGKHLYMSWNIDKEIAHLKTTPWVDRDEQAIKVFFDKNTEVETLSNCPLTEFVLEKIGQLKHLKHVGLDLSDIPNNLQALSLLKATSLSFHGYLNDNHQERLFEICEQIGQLTQLEHLEFAINAKNEEAVKPLGQLKKLKSLTLYYKVETLGFLSELSQLESYESMSTTQSGVNLLPNPKKLRKLVLRAADEKDLAVLKGGDLEECIIRYCNISDASIEIFQSLTKLKKLELHSVLNDKFIINLARYLPYLEDLDLTSMQITPDGIAVLKEFPNLQLLTMRSSQINAASASSFMQIKSLRQIDCVIDSTKSVRRKNRLFGTFTDIPSKKIDINPTLLQELISAGITVETPNQTVEL